MAMRVFVIKFIMVRASLLGENQWPPDRKCFVQVFVEGKRTI